MVGSEVVHPLALPVAETLPSYWSSRRALAEDMARRMASGETGASMTLFDMPVSSEARAKISDQRSRTRRQKSWLRIGIHPASKLHIVENGETCGSCDHLVVRSRNRTYFKCGLMPETHGPGTDIRKKWPACIEWKEMET